MYSPRLHQAFICRQNAPPDEADRKLLVKSGRPNSRPFVVSLFLLLATVGGGLAIRFVPLGLPYGVMKYGGLDTLGVDDLLDLLDYSSVLALAYRGFVCWMYGHGDRVRQALSRFLARCLSSDAPGHPAARVFLLSQ